MAMTVHARNDRKGRYNAIKDNHLDNGDTIAIFFWDRGHKNGPELHEVTATGVINIFNARTKNLVTSLIARWGQVTRYLNNPDIETLFENEKSVRAIKKLCIEHERKGLNHR